MENDVGNFRIVTFSVILPETWGIFLKEFTLKTCENVGVLKIVDCRVSYSYPNRLHSTSSSSSSSCTSVPDSLWLQQLLPLGSICWLWLSGSSVSPVLGVAVCPWKFQKDRFQTLYISELKLKIQHIVLSFLSRRGTSLRSIYKWQRLLTWPQLTASGLGNVVLGWKSALVIVCEEARKP